MHSKQFNLLNRKINASLIFYTLLIALVLYLQACAAPVIVAGTVAGAGGHIVSDRRDASTIIEDQILEMRATDAIYSDKKLGKKVRISVTSINGLVLLSGEAPTQEMRIKAAEIVRNLQLAREIYNEIQVSEPITLDKRTHDSWITSKIRARLMARKGLFTGIKVITSDGIAYLMGVTTPEEANEAAKVASNVSGTKQIIALFEPIDADGAGHKRVISTGNSQQSAENVNARINEENDIRIAEPSESPPSPSTPTNLSSEQ
ncbi:MAG: BON domain-containing protein [Gammaproteobacteria bacterium]|nr:BON domain-containing protein [Gammaproteobacteria bacterium]